MLAERDENAKKSDMLMGLLQLPYNRTCADCGFIIGEGLVKANAALGVFICLYCSECHTAVLPLSVCAIKSVDGYSMNMRLARWSYNEIRFMARWGNRRANAFNPHLAELMVGTGERLCRQIHSGETIDSQPNLIGSTYLGVILTGRENHIRGKYKLKAFVIPGSVPSFTDFCEAELQILNDRGYGHYQSNGTRLYGTPKFRHSMPVTMTVTKRLRSTSPITSRPSVKLPPHCPVVKERRHSSADPPPNRTTSELIFSASDEKDQTPTTLPGMRWAEKWHEESGIQGMSAAFAGKMEMTKASSQLLPHLLEDAPKDRLARSQTPPVSVVPFPNNRNRYMVRIPPLSTWQRDNLTTPWIATTQYDTSLPGHCGHHAYPPVPSLAKTALGSMTTQRRQPLPNQPLQSQQTSRQLSNTINGQEPISVPETLWEGLVPETFVVSQHNNSIVCDAQTLFDNPPSFPFTHLTDMDTFPFHPHLPQTPSISFHASEEVQAEESREDWYCQKPASTEHSGNLNIEQDPRTKHMTCYEWNYYFDCPVSKEDNCQKLHICEICASSEHRAAQHWHHLATAPLPEIQIRPQLSTIVPPPQSPTVTHSADRVPLFVPPCSSDLPSHLSDSRKAISSRVPLFVPSLGISQTQKAAAQSERLRLRKRTARTKSNSSTDNRLASELDIAREVIGNSKSQRIKIMAPPCSPFDKPVEVILPPPVRPFQGKETASTNNVDQGDSLGIGDTSKGRNKLRVTAPAFEPSHAGAWIPFSSPTNQFGELFKVPSRENKKIEIIAPKNKGKEVVRGTRKIVGSRKLDFRDGSTTSGRSHAMDLHNRSLKWHGEKPILDVDVNLTRNPGSSKAVHEKNTEPDSSGWSTQHNISQGSSSLLISKSRWKAIFNSQSLDSTVLKILDEQLEAIIGNESEETIAATLETIIEICSTPSTETSPCTNQFEPNRQAFANEIPQHFQRGPTWPSQDHIQAHHLQIPESSQLASSAAVSFFSLDDFAEDRFFSPLSPIPEVGKLKNLADQNIRPRSSDSSSTAPLDPSSTPQTPSNLIDLKDHCTILPDQTPLTGRIERMMSCAASHGVGQCNCGLGDWFHHIRA